MIVFWVIAAALLGAALLFIVPPLLGRGALSDSSVRRDTLNVSIYRDQLAELERDLDNDVLSREQYDLGKQELERRMLEDVEVDATATAKTASPARTTGVVLVVLLPVLAVVLYLVLGNMQGLSPDDVEPPAMSQQEFTDQINRMVEQLAARLQANPEDGEGWKMLGRSYLALEQFARARDAFEEAVKRIPQDAQLLADLADAVAMSSGESLNGRPLELIRQALAIDPSNQKALWLAGTAAYESQDYRAALEYWQRLSEMMPPGSEGAQSMAANINEVKELMRQRGEEIPQLASVLPQASGTGVTLSGTVNLSAALEQQVSDQDALFIFAQAAEGPRMPLAVARVSAGDLPYKFKLDDSMAMAPNVSLSRFDQVVVTARISKSGNASPGSGDLQGQTATISHNAQDVQITIDKVLP